MTKQWYQSKTLWLNAITLIISIIGLLINQPWLPAKYIVLVTSIILPILNMILRLLSTGTVIEGTPASK